MDRAAVFGTAPVRVRVLSGAPNKGLRSPIWQYEYTVKDWELGIRLGEQSCAINGAGAASVAELTVNQLQLTRGFDSLRPHQIT